MFCHRVRRRTLAKLTLSIADDLSSIIQIRQKKSNHTVREDKSRVWKEYNELLWDNEMKPQQTVQPWNLKKAGEKKIIGKSLRSDLWRSSKFCPAEIWIFHSSYPSLHVHPREILRGDDMKYQNCEWLLLTFDIHPKKWVDIETSKDDEWNDGINQQKMMWNYELNFSDFFPCSFLSQHKFDIWRAARADILLEVLTYLKFFVLFLSEKKSKTSQPTTTHDVHTQLFRIRKSKLFECSAKYSNYFK